MGCDYDKLYGETRDALGPPAAATVDFFDQYERRNAPVLDVGCGQGRDAVFIARRGQRVVGVDLSANGIRDLRAVAEPERLAVEAIVADIEDDTPSGAFDVILIDRTLHMLTRDAQFSVLSTLLDHVSQNGWVLIADEESNIDGFQGVIAADRRDRTVEHRQRGHLFVRRALDEGSRRDGDQRETWEPDV
jgi:2-polyprenyl-3-methyl-5-hydroxy-6-metoxy-1,4-benzoquinol methylase